ncbi:MAG: hypothetical protein CVU11_12495 [Bacteroidetes bacterium HGW-Bacteroidetes-6]|jgi:hypothetical protein|nr:MAG: hypothetical protein CVU11_12495 [Bacteroidetes bacterium HGW-Bacteroidetes-6]
MDYQQIKTRLAPCGIHCGKCFAFIDGDIKKHSHGLKESLGNFDMYAQRFAELLNEPLFEKYPVFKEVLTYLSAEECKGCREESCNLFKDCKVRSCHLDKKVDFCFQCPEFPCNNTGFDQHLYNRSVDINMRMRAIGVEKYYDEIKDEPRYK